MQGSGCEVEGAGLRVQGAGCRVQSSGFRMYRRHAEPLALGQTPEDDADRDRPSLGSRVEG